MSKVTIGNDIVAAAKQELVDKIKANVDMDRIRDICENLFGIKSLDSMDFRGGDIVVHEGNVSYKLEYSICFSLPLLINENGDFIGVENRRTTVADTPEERVGTLGQQAGEMVQEF